MKVRLAALGLILLVCLPGFTRANPVLLAIPSKTDGDTSTFLTEPRHAGEVTDFYDRVNLAKFDVVIVPNGGIRTADVLFIKESAPSLKRGNDGDRLNNPGHHVKNDRLGIPHPMVHETRSFPASALVLDPLASHMCWVIFLATLGCIAWKRWARIPV